MNRREFLKTTLAGVLGLLLPKPFDNGLGITDLEVYNRPLSEASVAGEWDQIAMFPYTISLWANQGDKEVEFDPDYDGASIIGFDIIRDLDLKTLMEDLEPNTWYHVVSRFDGSSVITTITNEL